MNIIYMRMIIPFILNSLLLSQDLHLTLISSDHKKPIYLTSIEGASDRLFIVEQTGLIKVLENGVLHLFLNIKDRVHQSKMPGDERGLLGMALHPKFSINGQFYVNYVDRQGDSIISCFKSDKNGKQVDPLSEKIILKVNQPYSNHNGGQLAFGPDGMLYIGLGDGGYAGDPKLNGQNLETLLGKILRLNVNDTDAYLIPKDNPFINDHDKKEIFCYGLRNPWRFSFDRDNGDLYIGDVGQSSWEEINYLTYENAFGSNLGWNVMEGSYCYPIDEDCDKNNFVFPIFEYPNNANYVKTLIGWDQNDVQGCSVTGGYVYRGKMFSEIYGQYFFGDYCTGKIWSIEVVNGELVTHHEWNLKGIEEDLYLSSFGEDGQGELYMINHTGNIYKVTGFELHD